MSIQKKSLISTLKTAKANVAPEHKGEKQVSALRVGNFKTLKAVDGRSLKSLRVTSQKLAG